MHNVRELLWYWLSTLEDCISCVRSLVSYSSQSTHVVCGQQSWVEGMLGTQQATIRGGTAVVFQPTVIWSLSKYLVKILPTFLCPFVKGQICETKGGICICGQVDVDRLLNSQLGARERDIVRLHYGVGCHDGNRMSLETISHRPVFFFSLSVCWSVLISMLSCSLEVRTHWRKKLEYSGVSK